MDSTAYEKLIRSFCEVAGLDDYPALVEGKHIEVDGHVVGLIHDEDDIHSDELSVYVELDEVVPMADADFYLRLLQANVARDHGLKGHFGVHPGTGRATYCIRVNAGPGLEGASLVDVVRSEVRDAALVFAMARN